MPGAGLTDGRRCQASGTARRVSRAWRRNTRVRGELHRAGQATRTARAHGPHEPHGPDGPHEPHGPDGMDRLHRAGRARRVKRGRFMG